ncbi:nuclear pore complex protein Nup88 isoform X2 [Periplaneta americana]|uniref:nuclear pore complex protein Nup88 isoform X2 n=1 Tax=Periplaneta americana TaxID=6978 RepID=UPI0037E82E91
MEGCTDRLGLSERKLFKIVRENLTKLNPKTRNIIECKEDVLFVWNSKDNCLLTLNVKTAKEDHADSRSYQTLLPTDPPSFEVERLVMNGTASQIAIMGPKGVAVLDLPRRWGKEATFQGGKAVITCRCRIVDDHYFVCSPHVEVRRARWHPGSRTDAHLLVLTSENSFRLYETGGSEPQLKQVWPLGRQPSATLSSGPRLPFLVGLGDTAVDFDFAPPVPLDSKNPPIGKENTKRGATDRVDPNAIVWPVLVLRGNGDVYSVNAPLSESSEKPTVHGPLSMYPPADDNYGVDACSVLCLQSVPPVVVIATCSGTLYHCVLLNCAEDDDEDTHQDNRSSWSQYGSTYSLHTPDIALYVFESVELELGLALDDDDDTYTCPIHLHHDNSTDSRYFCTHDTGVHMMSLPFIVHLEEFAKAHDDSPPLELLNQPSSAEYLICTRTSSSSPLSPILGLAITSTPPVLITLLATGEVVSLVLPSVPLPASPAVPMLNGNDNGSREESYSPLKVLLKEPFDVHIKKFLKHNISQPILKLGPNADPSPQECLELVSRTTQLFREEYFQRHDRVREEIERRVRTLQTLKQHQLQELEHMEQEKAKLKQTAERLAEKYEDTKDKQEELTKRAENILRLVSQRQPVLSSAEKKLMRDMKDFKEKFKDFQKALEQVKAKQNYHKVQMEQWVSNQKKRELYLGQTHMKTIKVNMAQMTNEIAELVKMVEISKQELGL